MSTVSASKADRDLRWIFLVLGMIFLAAAILVIISSSIWSWSRKNPLWNSSIYADHIVVTTRPVPLTHFVDRNSDGIMQKAERAIRKVEAGCYRFTAVGPDTVWDHYPEQTYDLASIIRINGNDTGHSFLIQEGKSPIVSFDPSFGQGRLIQTGEGGYEVVKITLIPSKRAECEA